ncbi:MAG: leucine-rich repeat domain-containing protein [Bacteroides sp.]|nr:leucine-rich repeat domain-containing protein [Bacteroides sp.]
MKKTVTFCFCIFLSSLCVLADSTFVDAGIVYKLISVDSVNIMALKEGHADVVLRDSVLNVPANVRHDGRLYHVRCIGKEAFAGNCGIKHVAIGKGIEEIQEHAFAACANMESISIPASVTVIGDGMFKYCVSLDSVCIDDGNKTYDSRGGCNAIILSESNRLLFGCKGTRIPASVECIGKDAFYGCMIDSIVIPEGVTRIHDYAFVYCQNLTRIHISSTVDWIDECAFSFCSNITTITVDEGNKTFDSRGDCNAIIQTSEERLMSGCNSTIIPDGVMFIHEDAFVGSGITAVDFPASVMEIDSMAFRGCDRCMSITVAHDNPYYKSDGSNSVVERKTGRLVLGCATTRFLPGVTGIGAYAFASTPEVLVLPDGIRDIGICAFANCRNLSAIIVPSSVKHIGRGAFSGCSRLCHKVIMCNDVMDEAAY